MTRGESFAEHAAASAGTELIRAATFEGMLGVGLPFVAVVVVLILAMAKLATALGDHTVDNQARLMTHSSAFWARWPGDRLAAAPYPELQAEADRCEQLITLTRAALRPARYGKPHLGPDHYLHTRLAAYQGMLGAVHRAMAQSAGRQGWPPQRP
ncbi:hypothetical protein E4P42_09110 [Mycobacterium sp. PS03-16]|uniref:hypothetical protein n=1 Tax=Mycobacterium sp. PS03-16 TaxID=2559611 RepID=UPI0010736A8A|nr:hypothetical protein [Mycobacterium sp. PS03-16]TFV59108.1 hypothetical protein E4P42_09110 [Mycobacterium sp. PS03-16]